MRLNTIVTIKTLIARFKRLKMALYAQGMRFILSYHIGYKIQYIQYYSFTIIGYTENYQIME
jgi:hypothetical protein